MIIRDIIYESARSDRLMRQEALRLFRSLQRQTRRPLTRGSMYDKKFARSLAYIETPYPDLAIGLLSGIEFPALSDNLASTLPRRIQHVMVFPLQQNSDSLAIDYRRAAAKLGHLVVADLISAIGQNPESFVHEFTHYRDIQKAGGYLRVGYDPTTPLQNDPHADRAYFNDPLEINGFYNMAVARLDMLPREFFRVPFRQWLLRVVKYFRWDFLVALDRKNKRRVMSRLYMMWAEKQ